MFRTRTTMQELEAPRKRRLSIDARRLALWGAALAVVSSIVHIHGSWGPGLADRSGRFRAPDYVQFYVSGSLILHGHVDRLYDVSAHVVELHRRIGPEATVTPPMPNYGPQLSALFVPLAGLSFPVSLAVFTVLSVCSYAAAVFFLFRSSPQLKRYGRVVAILALAYPTLAVTLRYGQLSTFTLLLTALSAWSLHRGQHLAGGLWFGMLAFKPPLLAVVLLAAAIARQWRFLGGAALTAGCQLVLGLAIAGPDTMWRYLQVLRTLAADPDVIVLFPETSHSVRGFLMLLGLSSAASSAISMATLAATAIVGGLSWRRTRHSVQVFGWMVLATVLASPHVLTYDLLLLAVPITLFSGWAVAHRDHPSWAIVTALLVSLYFAPFSVQLAARPFNVQASTLCALALAIVSATLLHEDARSLSNERLRPGTEH